MRTPTNIVQAIYNHAIQTQRAQGVGKPFFVVLTKTEQTAIHEKAKMDIEKIAQAAGVEMLKTARIAMRHGVRQQQAAGLEQLNEMLRKIRETDDKEEAIKWGLFAAGYANGMCRGDLMSKSELDDVIEVIDQTFKKAEKRIKATSRLQMFRKLVRP